MLRGAPSHTHVPKRLHTCAHTLSTGGPASPGESPMGEEGETPMDVDPGSGRTGTLGGWRSGLQGPPEGPRGHQAQRLGSEPTHVPPAWPHHEPCPKPGGCEVGTSLCVWGGGLRPPWANEGQARRYPCACFPRQHCCRAAARERGCSPEGPVHWCWRAASQGPVGTRVWTQANVMGTCVRSGRQEALGRWA